MAYVAIMPADHLWEGELSGVSVSGKPILLVRVGERVHAYEDRCAHKRALLSDGTLDGTRLRCRAHGWEYDVTSGASLNPCGFQLQCFATRIEQGKIWVDIHKVPAATEGDHG